MHILIITLILLLLLFGPQLWVQAVLKRHGKPRADFPGTGGEFAAHLVGRLGLRGVQVEASEQGDHYDPDSKKYRPTHLACCLFDTKCNPVFVMLRIKGIRIARRHRFIDLSTVARIR